MTMGIFLWDTVELRRINLMKDPKMLKVECERIMARRRYYRVEERYRQFASQYPTVQEVIARGREERLRESDIRCVVSHASGMAGSRG